MTVVVKPQPFTSRTYTLDADFDEGDLLNVTHSTPNQLQLDSTTRTLNFIWVAVSTKGTVVKINTETGAIIGEYFTSPAGQPERPLAHDRGPERQRLGDEPRRATASSTSASSRTASALTATTTASSTPRPASATSAVAEHGRRQHQRRRHARAGRVHPPLHEGQLLRHAPRLGQQGQRRLGQRHERPALRPHRRQDRASSSAPSRRSATAATAV